jgi:hypothetical protein
MCLRLLILHALHRKRMVWRFGPEQQTGQAAAPPSVPTVADACTSAAMMLAFRGGVMQNFVDAKLRNKF